MDEENKHDLRNEMQRMEARLTVKIDALADDLRDRQRNQKEVTKDNKEQIVRLDQRMSTMEGLQGKQLEQAIVNVLRRTFSPRRILAAIGSFAWLLIVLDKAFELGLAIVERWAS